MKHLQHDKNHFIKFMIFVDFGIIVSPCVVILRSKLFLINFDRTKTP